MAYRQKNKNTSEWYPKKKKILNTKDDTLSEESNKVTAIQK